MTAPARTCGQQETTSLARGFPAREPSPEEFPLTSGNCQSLSARTGEGRALADAPEPLAPYIEPGPSINQPTGRKKS
jgi:hypothetical protein